MERKAWSLSDNLGRLKEVSESLVDVDKELLLLRGIVENVPAAIVGADQSGIINFFNVPAQRLFGRTPAEVHGQPITILMPERYWEAHTKGLQAYIDTMKTGMTGRRITAWGLHSTGAEFPIEIELGIHSRDGHVFFTALIRPTGPVRQPPP